MKPATLLKRLEPLMPTLRCPRCGSAFAPDGTSLVCENRHCYDVSRRGYINLAPNHNQAAEKYDEALFDSRRIVFEGGFYTPIMDAIAAQLTNAPGILLDVGCGEGWYARTLSERFPNINVLGIDISRDAITAAAQAQSRANFLVADLKHLPVADQSLDILLDVLTPADYAEFSRVLKPDGVLIKVIPGTDYLQEVRKAVSPWLRSGDTYDNTRVLEHLKQNTQVLSEQEIRITTPLTPEQSRAFLRMTPMTFSIDDSVLNTLTLSDITIHMHILTCR